MSLSGGGCCGTPGSWSRRATSQRADPAPLRGGPRAFLLDYIDLLVTRRGRAQASGIRPGADAEAAPASGTRRERWVINKVRALDSWYTKGLENGSHLHVRSTRETIPQLRDLIADFFFSYTPSTSVAASAASTSS